MICTLIGFIIFMWIAFKLLDMRVWELIVLVALFSIIFGCCAQAYEYTPEEIVAIGKIVQHECPHESELGQRLVIDTILNRVEHEAFPNTVRDVLNQPGQYCNPKKYPPNDIYKLIAQEIYTRTNNQVLWYRTKQYHKYGIPIVKEGSHFFSGGV